MSIISRTPNMGLTQFDGDIASHAGIYSRYNSDMETIDTQFHTLDETVNGEEGLGAQVTALSTSVGEISEKADNAVSTANDAKDTVTAMDNRVTTVEGKVADLESWKDVTVDPTLTAYDQRLDAIELVIDTVSTANINDFIERMDALEQKVDTNTSNIDTLNGNLIEAVDRIEALEADLGTTNANLNAVTNRVSVLESCCEEVRGTLADHNGRINQNASDISALDARLTRDETNIAGNASDITILATQNSTQAEQISDLYDKYNALDPTSPANLYSRVSTLETVVGDTPLQTVAQTVTGAINELFGNTSDVDADEVGYDNTNSELVATDVQGAIDEVVGVIDTDEARIEALETTVGGAGSGLVKDVSDLQTSVGTLETTVGDNTAGLVKDVSALQTTVGDATAGLVKDVADNASDITALDGRVDALEEGIVYSTTEQLVGKWIDGNDLYQNTVVGQFGTITDGTVSDIAIDDSIPSDAASVFIVFACQISNTAASPIPYFKNDLTRFVKAYLLNGAVRIASNWSNFSNTKIYVTIQYTKTTT